MSDLMDTCNPDKKYTIEVFEKAICYSCMNPKCERSRFTDDATKAKKAKHDKLMSTIPIEVSPLSVDKDNPTVDPWKAPSVDRNQDLHKTYQDKKDDPWSSSYKGGIEMRKKPGSTIRMTK
jgi:hypothetical protein